MSGDRNGRGTAVVTADRVLLEGVARTRRTALSLMPHATFADWTRVGRQLFLITDSSSWWLADWLIFGQDAYPDRYRRAVEQTGLDYQTLRNYAWVARRFPAERRRAKLSLQHHAEVAALGPQEQDAWLSRAEEGNWSRNLLRRNLKNALSNGSADAPAREVRVHIKTTAEREVVWARAAEGAGQSLPEWIIERLDEAAGEAAPDAAEGADRTWREALEAAVR
ncbi:LmbU family transcriptional regulator [Streptomyces sp. NPDC005408]|uniref:LmbU family transcriptional regulator n=1 Tax=Streptomyces sp. NPDC005408 TaxID=3155341 RepID=UPI0033ACAD59